MYVPFGEKAVSCREICPRRYVVSSPESEDNIAELSMINVATVAEKRPVLETYHFSEPSGSVCWDLQRPGHH